ncbi:uncharacterized protein LOC117242250 [Bombus vosnesenskii]|uniref:Uncharacterized protein LOC117242250 n=1 Tax=Bombus vosnesenskii TaxID=207650 RepID=A0A6J3LL75_9HYME|nr:uncharacterized protein LOC117242250 [Bombus vosnesenskii]
MAVIDGDGLRTGATKPPASSHRQRQLYRKAATNCRRDNDILLQDTDSDLTRNASSKEKDMVIDKEEEFILFRQGKKNLYIDKGYIKNVLNIHPEFTSPYSYSDLNRTLFS